MELDLFFWAADTIKESEPPADVERKEQKLSVPQQKEGNRLPLHTVAELRLASLSHLRQIKSVSSMTRDFLPSGWWVKIVSIGCSNRCHFF